MLDIIAGDVVLIVEIYWKLEVLGEGFDAPLEMLKGYAKRTLELPYLCYVSCPAHILI